MRVYQIDSQKKYSVSTIISLTKSEQAQQAIQKWREQHTEEERQEILNRGTKVHWEIEQYLNGITPDSPSELFEQVKDPLLSFLVKSKNIVATEKILYSKEHEWAGKCDCICNIDYKLTILDWKTSSKIPFKREYLDDYFLQCAAYALLYQAINNVSVEQLAVVVITPNKWKLFYEHDVNKWFVAWEEKFELFQKILAEKKDALLDCELITV
jgi:ATP-dependent exoDNAse (exonuclease V) beta subunit